MAIHAIPRKSGVLGNPEGIGRQMEEVKEKVYRQETVRLDGKLFVNCIFEDCMLCYSGERCEWEHTRFSNCRVLLDGGANNTIQVLQGLGFKIMPPVSGDLESTH
jgi:hypothetical protein